MQEASNDQPGFLFPSISFLSCSASNASELESSSIDIPFNYELFTAQDADVTAALEEFESALLGGVALELGLMGCNGGEERKKRGLKVVSNSKRGLMKEPSVDGVSSEPVDEITGAECTTKMVDSSKLTEATCTSISGHMTTWLPSSTTRQLSSSESTIQSVYDAIETYISNSYTSNSIVGVSYIPVVEEQQQEVSNEVVITGSKTTDSRESSVSTLQEGSSWELLPGAGLLAVIVSLLALVGLVHIIKKKRSNSNDNDISPTIAAIEPEISAELSSQPPTPNKGSGGLPRCLSDTEDEDNLSVATEVYPAQDYTKDEYIKRMPTYGSAWGDRTATGFGSLFGGRIGSGFSTLFSGGGEKMNEVVDVANVNDDDDLPSEMGEEIEL